MILSLKNSSMLQTKNRENADYSLCFFIGTQSQVEHTMAAERTG